MQYKITSAQEKWREDLRSLGCIITGEPNPEMHHLYGASIKKKCPRTFQTLWIGQWAQVPLVKRLHDAEKEPWFRDKYPDDKLFEIACYTYSLEFGDLPFDQNMYDAIINYHRKSY